LFDLFSSIFYAVLEPFDVDKEKLKKENGKKSNKNRFLFYWLNELREAERNLEEEN
jgi:hypothetical protein